MEQFTVRSVLDKMDNSDSDFRYMAASDLLSQLSNENIKIRADHDLQKRLCRSVLKLLKDSNSEVQGMATKCLAPLTLFVDSDNSIFIVITLLDFILRNTLTKSRSSAPPDVIEQKAVHDIASLAMKSILRSLPTNSPKSAKITTTILPQLIKSISSNNSNISDQSNIDIIIDTLELLFELLSRVGTLIVGYHRQISEGLFCHFSSKHVLIKKRAIQCLAVLSSVCDNTIFINIVERCLIHLQQNKSKDGLRTGVQTISALSKISGHRLSSHLHILVPILLTHVTVDEDNNNEGDDDFREHCLQALESCCLRCRREMLPFASTLANACIILSKYDPNYIVDEDDENNNEEDDDGMDDDDDGFDDVYDDDDYSDDDDVSWKIRRAAVGCIYAMITSQLLSTSQLCSQFGPFLITRFKDREESVKLDIFSAFDQLVRLCGGRSLDSTSLIYSSGLPGTSTDAMAVDGGHVVVSTSPTSPEIESLLSHGPALIRSLKKELSSRSSKTKVKAMSLFRSVVTSLPALAKPIVSEIMNEIKQGLADLTTGMRTETLLLLQSIITIHGDIDIFNEHIETLIRCVLSAADDKYYKVTAECLKFLGITISLCKSTSKCKSEVIKLVPVMYDTSMNRLIGQDQDSEVKDGALLFLVNCVINMYDIIEIERIQSLMNVLIIRLKKSGTSQLSAIRYFHKILLSENCSSFIKFEMNEIAPIIYSFLRKSDQSLRRSAIELLTIVPSLPSNNDELLIENISQLVSDTDLRMASMALDVSVRILNTRGTDEIISLIVKPESIYPKALTLSKSPLLQGRAIESLLKLFNNLSKMKSNILSIEQILQDLELQAENVSFGITTSSSRSSPLYCIGKCIVVVCREAENELRIDTTKRIIDNINSTYFKTRIFALACLSEFGRGSLLPEEGNEKEIVHVAILKALDAPTEEVKTAAAVALGGLASSDNASGIPNLINLIKQRTQQKYLLLLSLKEAISSVSETHLKRLVSIILPLLLEEQQDDDAVVNYKKNGNSEEESIRTATAECLGLMVVACPDVVIETLICASNSSNPDIRAAVVGGIKFAISWSMMNQEIPSIELRNKLTIFINMIDDSDVMVSKNAIQAINAIAKSYPKLLIGQHLNKILPLIYKRTMKNKDLIRVVDLGPFKHEEDYGLDLRKCAFDCLRTLISSPLLRSSIHLVGLLEYVVVGLRDQADVKSIAQLIVMSAAYSENAAQMVNVMDSLVGALDATLNEQLKDNAVRQEIERYEESIRGALRAIRAMENVSEICGCVSFQSLLNGVVRTPKLLDRYETIAQQEVNLLSMNNSNGRNGSHTKSNYKNNNDDSMRD